MHETYWNNKNEDLIRKTSFTNRKRNNRFMNKDDNVIFIKTKSKYIQQNIQHVIPIWSKLIMNWHFELRWIQQRILTTIKLILWVHLLCTSPFLIHVWRRCTSQYILVAFQWKRQMNQMKALFFTIYPHRRYECRFLFPSNNKRINCN